MRKFFYIICTFAILASCTSSREIPVASNISVSIDTRSVIDAYTPWRQGDLDMYEGSWLSVYCYIYDMDGKLVHKDSGVLDDYSIASWDIKGLQMGNYQVVCLSFAEDDESSAYSTRGVDNLDTFEITQEYWQSFYSNWACLGIYYDKISIGEENTIEIKLAPVCSYVRMDHHDMTAIDDEMADGVSVWFKNNETIDFRDGELRYSNNLSTQGFHYVHVEMPGGDFTGVYQTFFFLPVQDMELMAYYLCGEEEFNEFGSTTVTLESGEQYYINVYYPEQKIIIEEYTKADVIPGRLAKTSKSLNVSDYFGIRK